MSSLLSPFSPRGRFPLPALRVVELNSMIPGTSRRSLSPRRRARSGMGGRRSRTRGVRRSTRSSRQTTMARRLFSWGFSGQNSYLYTCESDVFLPLVNRADGVGLSKVGTSLGHLHLMCNTAITFFRLSVRPLSSERRGQRPSLKTPTAESAGPHQRRQITFALNALPARSQRVSPGFPGLLVVRFPSHPFPPGQRLPKARSGGETACRRPFGTSPVDILFFSLLPSLPSSHTTSLSISIYPHVDSPLPPPPHGVLSRHLRTPVGAFPLSRPPHTQR